MRDDAVLVFSEVRGFGERFWNLCPVCDSVAILATFWEDGTADHGECLACKRRIEIMELEDSLSIEPPIK